MKLLATRQIRSRHKTAEFQLDSAPTQRLLNLLAPMKLPIDCARASRPRLPADGFLPPQSVDATRVILEISKEEQEFIEGSIG